MTPFTQCVKQLLDNRTIQMWTTFSVVHN